MSSNTLKVVNYIFYSVIAYIFPLSRTNYHESIHWAQMIHLFIYNESLIRWRVIYVMYLFTKYLSINLRFCRIFN